ncbi:hypothetical protein PU629_12600 [Pullulanibacillus sp. KACC 23026]|uniref:hypothetical protein n=1 Tax=Pullulanibacillus sp. KACC 23026 TaxID=3028315 RepID=UPI0023AECEC3|nr:hypothetical protein [Pullulanibacillus sp. KACC 23026]WEG11017.1 hypothetical protein PU629_12600 [Pullulanibacillus sp. KACC 23026]
MEPEKRLKYLIMYHRNLCEHLKTVEIYNAKSKNELVDKLWNVQAEIESLLEMVKPLENSTQFFEHQPDYFKPSEK